MWMAGLISDEQWKTIDSPLVERRTQAKGNEEDAIYYEKSLKGLSYAEDLLRLVGSSKVNQLETLTEKLYDINSYIDGQGFPITKEEVEQILRLLQELDEALAEYVDKEEYIYPDKINYVLDKAPSLIVTFENNGVKKENLGSPILYYRLARNFLRIATELDRKVWLT